MLENPKSQWFTPVKVISVLLHSSLLYSCTIWNGMGGKDGGGKQAFRCLSTNMTHMALLLMFHWSKLFTQLQPHCQGDWEKKRSTFIFGEF